MSNSEQTPEDKQGKWKDGYTMEEFYSHFIMAAKMDQLYQA